MDNELTSSPELDRRVCEILGIEKPDCPHRDYTGYAKCRGNCTHYPDVSSDPATIGMVMDAIREKLKSDVSLSINHLRRRCAESKSFCVRVFGKTYNLALCGLALKLGEK